MSRIKKNTLRVLTWHVHGNYLYYLTQTNCIFYLPVIHPASPGYFGKTRGFPWGSNVIEVPAQAVRNLSIDCIIFQSNFSPQNPNKNFLLEQLAILSSDQLRYVPKIFVEHDPPRDHPTDTKHILYNSSVVIVHVTKFNQLMWDCGNTKTEVIEHGVVMPKNVNYSGVLEKGVVVINGLYTRGRRLGKDIFERVRKEIPLDLIGIDSERIGGLGEISMQELPSIISQYRFLFYPIRYTSLGLSFVEAMMIGVPVVGLATTELPTIIRNGKNGYVHTDPDFLIGKMKKLLHNEPLAQRIGENAKKTAQKRFSIKRFTAEWERLITQVSARKKENNITYKNMSLSV